MKNLFVLLSFCIVIFLGSCLSEENERWSDFSGVYVTVAGDDVQGYRLYTDFDAVLEPTQESLSQLEWLKEARRVIVGFDMIGETEELKPGQVYSVILKSAQLIPTFIVGVDTLSIDYQNGGKDSIALKNEPIRSIEESKGSFYVKNGYLNLVPTFDYSPVNPVYFLLYYDGVKDIDVVNNKFCLNLYFNNSTESPYGDISSFISMEIPYGIYSRFIGAGKEDSDSITCRLNVEAFSGNKEIECKLSLKDLQLP